MYPSTKLAPSGHIFKSACKIVKLCWFSTTKGQNNFFLIPSNVCLSLRSFQRNLCPVRSFGLKKFLCFSASSYAHLPINWPFGVSSTFTSLNTYFIHYSSPFKFLQVQLLFINSIVYGKQLSYHLLLQR